MGRSVIEPFGDYLGVGVDSVDVVDFERLPFEDNVAFYRRVFTAAEIEYCLSRPHPAQHFAARFAAKEAAVKAFNQDLQVAYWQVEVERAADGSPRLRVWNADRTDLLELMGAARALVSLSHSAQVATAVVVLTRSEK